MPFNFSLRQPVRFTIIIRSNLIFAYTCFNTVINRHDLPVQANHFSNLLGTH